MAMPAVSTAVATTLAEDSASASLSAYPNCGGPAVPQDLLNITPAQWAKCIRSATLLAWKTPPGEEGGSHRARRLARGRGRLETAF